MTEKVIWGNLDRWDYSNNTDGIPPHYTEYTGLTLSWFFILFFILTGAQFLLILLVKVFFSTRFFQKGDYLNKFLHLLLSLNLASPFEDWDQGKFSVKEYKERHRKTSMEMAWSQSVNIAFSLIMMIPLMYSG